MSPVVAGDYRCGLKDQNDVECQRVFSSWFALVSHRVSSAASGEHGQWRSVYVAVVCNQCPSCSSVFACRRTAQHHAMRSWRSGTCRCDASHHDWLRRQRRCRAHCVHSLHSTSSVLQSHIVASHLPRPPPALDVSLSAAANLVRDEDAGVVAAAPILSHALRRLRERIRAREAAQVGQDRGKRSAAEAPSSTQPPSQHDQEMVPVESLEKKVKGGGGGRGGAGARSRGRKGPSGGSGTAAAGNPELMTADVKSLLQCRQNVHVLNGGVTDTFSVPAAHSVASAMAAQGAAHSHLVQSQGGGHQLAPPHTYMFPALLTGLLAEREKAGAKNVETIEGLLKQMENMEIGEKCDIIRQCRLEKAYSGYKRLVLQIQHEARRAVYSALGQVGAERKFGRAPRGGFERGLEEWLEQLRL